MDKKTIIIINIIVLIAIIFGFMYFYGKTSQKKAVPTQNNTTEPTQVVPINGNKITPTVNQTQTQNSSSTPEGILKITGKDGESVLVNDFYKSPYTQVFDPQNDATIKESTDYSIEYQPNFQAFYINLNGNDLYISRTNAEQGLLDKLGISKDDACKLNVNLGVVYSVNPRASGVEYGLSFCPDGIPLPKNLNEDQNFKHVPNE